MCYTENDLDYYTLHLDDCKSKSHLLQVLLMNCFNDVVIVLKEKVTILDGEKVEMYVCSPRNFSVFSLVDLSESCQGVILGWEKSECPLAPASG